MRSPLRSPAQVEGPQGVLPQPEKDLERPSSTRLEARFPYYDLRVKTRSLAGNKVMPKDEFDFEDPFELNGMAFMTHEDTTNDMAETFIEEFMRMGYGHQQVLALFRNPHYVGPNMAFEKRGEPFIR